MKTESALSPARAALAAASEALTKNSTERDRVTACWHDLQAPIDAARQARAALQTVDDGHADAMRAWAARKLAGEDAGPPPAPPTKDDAHRARAALLERAAEAVKPALAEVEAKQHALAQEALALSHGRDLAVIGVQRETAEALQREAERDLRAIGARLDAIDALSYLVRIRANAHEGSHHIELTRRANELPLGGQMALTVLGNDPTRPGRMNSEARAWAAYAERLAEDPSATLYAEPEPVAKAAE
jgi:hypothetical protein